MGDKFNVIDAGKFVQASDGWAWKLRTADEQVSEAVREFVLASTNLLSDPQGLSKIAQSMPAMHSPAKNYHGDERNLETGADGTRQVGYSAQAHAAEELNAKLQELQGNISKIQPAYEAVKQMLVNIRDTFHPDFNSSLDPSSHKVNRQLLGGAATKLLQSMPPANDVGRLVQWSKLVSQHIGQQVGNMLSATKPVQHYNSLRKFWDKSFGKAFPLPKAPKAPAAAPASQQRTAVASSNVLWRAF